MTQRESQHAPRGPGKPIDEPRGSRRLAAQDDRRHHRHHGQCDDKRRDDDDADRDGDVLEVQRKAPAAGEEDQRQEHAQRRRGGGDDGQGHLAGACQRGAPGVALQLVAMAENRLDDDDRVIDQHA